MPERRATIAPSTDADGVQRLDLADGRRLAYELVGPTARNENDSGEGAVSSDPAAPVVLVVHGTPDSRLATPPAPAVPRVGQGRTGQQAGGEQQRFKGNRVHEVP